MVSLHHAAAGIKLRRRQIRAAQGIIVGLGVQNLAIHRPRLGGVALQGVQLGQHAVAVDVAQRQGLGSVQRGDGRALVAGLGLGHCQPPVVPGVRIVAPDGLLISGHRLGVLAQLVVTVGQNVVELAVGSGVLGGIQHFGSQRTLGQVNGALVVASVVEHRRQRGVPFYAAGHRVHGGAQGRVRGGVLPVLVLGTALGDLLQVIVDALPPQQIRTVQRQAGAGKPGSAQHSHRGTPRRHKMAVAAVKFVHILQGAQHLVGAGKAVFLLLGHGAADNADHRAADGRAMGGHIGDRVERTLRRGGCDHVVHRCADGVHVGAHAQRAIGPGAGCDRRREGRLGAAAHQWIRGGGGGGRRQRRRRGILRRGGHNGGRRGGYGRGGGLPHCPGGRGQVLLGRGVALGHADDGVVALEHERGVEVDQADVPLPGDHDVVRLDIAVQNRRRLGVQVGHDLAELAGPAMGQRLRHAAILLDILLQIHTWDVVHDGVQAPILARDNVVDAGQVLMLEAL